MKDCSSIEDQNYLPLYPSIEPFNSGFLQVSDQHQLYYEESGNPRGKPVVYLHGGPGGGSDPSFRRLFDPNAYHIIIFDQRGCGQSKPLACLENNTTWDLLADIEHIRKHLGISQWQVFGGSWGSTLALCYAINHPYRITELILRGIFLLRKQELRWFYQYGAHMIFPDLFEKYVAVIPENERNDLIAAYYKRLTSDDQEQQLSAAKAWSRWEGGTLSLLLNPERESQFSSEQFAIAFARIECHYFINGGFFPSENYLLENTHKIRHIPMVIVQGRYDMVTPLQAAWDLHKALPEAEFHIVSDAGHIATEPGLRHELIMASNKFRP